MEEDKKRFLTTPVHDSSSSVFLTPPLSDKLPNKTQTSEEMVSQKFPLIQNLMLTPTSPEHLKTEEHDIVTRFYLQGFPLIVEKIFSYLSAADLQKCAAVSSRWKLLCTNLKSIASRLPVKTDEKLKQKQKENQVARKAHKKQTDRLPLTSRNSNILSSQKIVPLSIPQTKQTKCPSCSSPAKEYNFVHAECCSCSYSFCPSCLGKAHTNNKSCSKRIRSSPTKRESSQLGVGTNLSKKRLRRL